MTLEAWNRLPELTLADLRKHRLEHLLRDVHGAGLTPLDLDTLTAAGVSLPEILANPAPGSRGEA